MAEVSLRRRIALDIAASIRKSETADHPLLQLFWESTLRCNLKCRHCGSDCKQIANTPDMPKEDFFKVLDGIASHTDPHKVFVIVSGGEPTMRPDLEECGKGIYSRGFPWGMVTNAYGLTPERYSRLLKSGLHSMTISLDGLQENHDWLRGRENSFERASKAIKMVVDSNAIAFDVVTCVNRRNFKELPLIKEHLIGLGLKNWRLFSIFPTGRAAQDPDLQLPSEMFRGLLDFIKETRKEGRIKASFGCEGFLGHYEGEVRDHFYTCQAGVTVGSVLIDGSISACTSIRSDYHQGNIYKDDFWDVWQNRFQPYRDRSWMKKDECGDCKWWKWCEGNGMHLRDSDGKLMLCHMKRITA
ncbi:MAG: TIGR04133 family radical SAM/SPASM protein [Bacteroidales bacterium]|nr:TIGR04133 family radical SAM/SPASM protein [Bacteroidales bacterium]